MILPAAVLALPWRLIGAVGLVAVVALMGWRVTRWHDAYAALPGLRDALAREEACEEGSQCADRVAALTARHDAIAQEVAADYARELADIAARPVPVQPVRLCRPRGAGGVPNGTAPGSVDGASAGRELPVVVGKDIAVELYRLADDADREALKLRWLQEWNRALSATEPPATPAR